MEKTSATKIVSLAAIIQIRSTAILSSRRVLAMVFMQPSLSKWISTQIAVHEGPSVYSVIYWLFLVNQHMCFYITIYVEQVNTCIN